MRLLIAMDSSSGSHAAVDEIVARPWPGGSTVEVLSVVEPTHLWELSITAEEAARRAKELVERTVEQLCSRGLTARGVVLAGDPKTAILDRLVELDADLAVVGSHNVSAVSRFLLGSVASAVARHAPCSVEIVRAPREGRSHPARKILLATDGSESSNAAALSIASRPWPTGVEIRVLTVVEFYLPPAQALLEPPFMPSSQVPQLQAEAMTHAQGSIAAAKEHLAAAGHEVSESISVLIENPKTVILEEARQWGADLIVLGSHGRRGLERFLLGGVAESVAMHADCSVEVIRHRSAS